MSECQGLACPQMRHDFVAVKRSLQLIGNQDHNDVSGSYCFIHLHDLESVFRDLVPSATRSLESDDDLQSKSWRLSA